ncbi:response regulator [Motiliproteus coralliicola]|uniref:Response regulator n=1 Tax=Motiliproteus coralliicola TaxID=2283196 RepID=A0A369WTW2_9GAMM|nr:response regulator [Motiliproteus coralliicola]RDE25107.1 response regulator [Motiliproteus coralliicola]
MPIPILICDDSGFARKQMARSLPENWNVDVSFAANGLEALSAIKEGQAHVLFLDLNMPLMDGYQVLEVVRSQDLPTLVIVVSGDVQPEARRRVMELGALDFIEKPINRDKLDAILQRYGVLQELEAPDQLFESLSSDIQVEFDITEGYQEVANVAMGQAADLLARLLHVFIELPIPQVRLTPGVQLAEVVAETVPNHRLSVVSQGFACAGISGEALLFIDESDLSELSYIFDPEEGSTQLDLLMEISNILIGACMSGVADQLELKFSVGHPEVLGRGIDVGALRFQHGRADEERLTIGIRYGIQEQRINCTLMLIFTGDSTPALEERVKWLVE